MISGRSVQQIDPDVYEVNALAFSPDGQYLAVGGTDPAAIIFYQIGIEEITPTTEIMRETTIQPSGEVHDLAWSPDGNLISDGKAVYRMLLHAPTLNATVRISSTPVRSLITGKLLTFPLTIENGENVAGYQATVSYDTTAL